MRATFRLVDRRLPRAEGRGGEAIQGFTKLGGQTNQAPAAGGSRHGARDVRPMSAQHELPLAPLKEGPFSPPSPVHRRPRPRTMSSQQGSLRHRSAHQSHRRRRSSPSTSPTRRRHPGSVSGRSPSDLVSLRVFVLSHIEEIERKLQSLESTNARCLFSDQDQDDTSAPESPCRSPPTEEADIYPSGSPSAGVSIPATPLSEELDLIVHEGLKRLHHLREEVSARLPDLEELTLRLRDIKR